MGLYISVHNPENDEYLDMNWLRNPFGLCSWAEDTFLYENNLEEVPLKESLWYAINHWNYDKSEQVDKKLFYEVVRRYAESVLTVPKGYFWYPLDRFPDNLYYSKCDQKQIPPTTLADISMIQNGHPADGFAKHNNKVGVPIEEVAQFANLGAATLESYQNWYMRLIQFAIILQSPQSVFYCSN